VLRARLPLTRLLAAAIWVLPCAPTWPQDYLDAPPPEVTPLWNADSTSLDGCQIIARIDNQIVLACEVQWLVNSLIEQNQDKIPPPEIPALRDQLLKREIASLLDHKLIYGEFLRNVPAERLPQIEEDLLEHFQEQEVPKLMEQLKVKDQSNLEQELARLGSSLADVRRSFNERTIAREWIRTKVKINEEVGPDELLQYYQSHLADFEYPAQARWEELMVRKDRFSNANEAYAEIARMGKVVWERGTAQGVRGPAFAEVAKAKSDGFTAKEGGLQDWTSKGALKAVAIDEALFSLQVGQMSPILESDEGFHIVRVLERKEAGREPFTEVQVKIRDKLKEQRFKVELEKYLGRLRRDARIWTAFTGNVSADVLMGRKPDETQAR
jgi:parvulin-like peptidyl-prolyl isomerase